MKKTAHQLFDNDLRFSSAAARFGSGGLSQSGGFISWISSLPKDSNIKWLLQGKTPYLATIQSFLGQYSSN